MNLRKKERIGVIFFPFSMEVSFAELFRSKTLENLHLGKYCSFVLLPNCIQ
jgi:hypothetical protein